MAKRWDYTLLLHSLDGQDLKAEYLKLRDEYRLFESPGWANTIGPELQQAYTPEQLAQGCTVPKDEIDGLPDALAASLKTIHVSAATAQKFYKYPPSKRHIAVFLALMLGYDEQRLNDLLTDIMYCGALYAKNFQDDIFLYMARTAKGRPIRDPARRYLHYCKCYAAALAAYRGGRQQMDPRSTEAQLSELYQVADRGDSYEFQIFLKNSIPSFITGRDRLNRYLHNLLEQKDASVDSLSPPRLRSAMKKYFASFSKDPAKNAVRVIEAPDRNVLISLALRLGLDTDGINELLEQAKMSPLASHDFVEGFLIGVIDHAALNSPESFHQILSIMPDTAEEIENEKLRDAVRDADRIKAADDFLMEYVYGLLCEVNDETRHDLPERHSAMKELLALIEPQAPDIFDRPDDPENRPRPTPQARPWA